MLAAPSRRSVLAVLAGWPLLVPAQNPAQAAARPRAPAAGGRAAPPLPLVVIDPGHGGKDPGAIGVSGTFEKHVAFAAASELHRQLQASGRCRSVLTRGRDVFVPLPDRVGFAQKRGAALFVSLHADALPDHGVRGASVYTMSDTASDAQTAALARRENSVDRLAPGLGGLPPDVAHILSALVRQETRQGSARMAGGVVRALGPAVGTTGNPSRHAAFAVLKAADVPSVLVEMGFMSNKADEAALRRPEYRALVAAAMRVAIESFIQSGNGAVRVAAG